MNKDQMQLPPGAHESEGKVNFVLFSQDASRVRIELFDKPQDTTPSKTIDLDPLRDRTGDLWHIGLEGIRHGQLYAYRVDGPFQPNEGHRFNFNKLLLDPLATAISPLPDSDFSDAIPMPKCIYTEDHFDWQDDRPIRHPWSKTIIYETHVRGFTIHPSSGVKNPGTYRGLMEKITYLKELGVTAIELMPVQEFNEYQITEINPLTKQPLKDYWGYNPILLCAPKASYSSLKGLGQQVLEFKEMVRAFHKAGMEVILDVVFNHTAEEDELGPTLSFRGIDNSVFYILSDDKQSYKDFTGTGNTVNANHPVVQEYILSALHTWVKEMHVDGFRFDLGAALGRDTNGDLLTDPPLLKRIADDPVLKDVKIIAEPWDAAGAYEVGDFSTQRWAEWNGRYRDDIRRFWRGDDGFTALFAQRICGSADLYTASGKSPANSINFLTCHDGFTLNDLVCYNDKHNEANGEDNKDGSGEDFSENYGVEGNTADAHIESKRKQQIKNFLLTLFISRGVPMLLGGDEFRRTQEGNNNPYCQDNTISWYDWSCLEGNKDIYQFTRGLIAFRRAHPVLSKDQFYTDAEIQWFSPQGQVPNWADPKEKQFSYLIQESEQNALFLMFNAGGEAIDFILPSLPPGGQWRLCVDTSHDGALEQFAKGEEQPLENIQTYRMNTQSSAILLRVKG